MAMVSQFYFYVGDGSFGPLVLKRAEETDLARARELGDIGMSSSSRHMISWHTNDGPRRAIYPPPHRRAMIERLYAHRALRRDLEEAPASAGSMAASRAQVRGGVFPEWSEASIRVTAYGADLPDLVRVRLRELCLRRVDWICLDLPLSQPDAVDCCAALEALGFFFAGVIPDIAEDDVCVCSI
jgi:hypothetical protein